MLTLHKNHDKTGMDDRGCVLAIGNFDGLHQGHRRLIMTAQDIARRENLPLAVMTFEPHPRSFFMKDAAPFRLTLLPAKQRILGEWGVQHLFAMDFNADLAALPAQDFIDNILIKHINAKHIVIGEDFAFGAKRAGSVAMLAASISFKVTAIAPVRCDNGLVYSSSRIREAIRAGDFATAQEHLGRAFAYEAPVIHGNKQGRILGYPTANQDIAAYAQMPFGVYAVRVNLDGMDYSGAANFGIRPMFLSKTPILETFIFDFSHDIYGKMMGVTPVAFLRAEMAFPDIDALKKQMEQDCIHARLMLKSF